jgi:hypothetical protein
MVIFYVHNRVVIFWYPQQYVPTKDCVAGTSCARGLGLCPRDLLCSWPWLCLEGLTLLVKLYLFITPTTPFFCQTQPLLLGQPNAALTIGAVTHNPNYWGSWIQLYLSGHRHASLSIGAKNKSGIAVRVAATVTITSNFKIPCELFILLLEQNIETISNVLYLVPF